MSLEFSSWTQLLELVRAPLFSLQGTPVSIMSFVIFILVIAVTFLLSRLIRMAFRRKFASRLEQGLDYTVAQIIHYVALIVGFLVAFETVGIDLSSLAIMFGFLGVGIGFGLQNIVANFISGLILLIERPIKVGDMVTVGDEVGMVQGIKLRYTEVNTRDNVDIIIPNSSFVEQNVINWSHGEDKVRLRIPIGVAYGVDAEEVKEILLDVVGEHPDLLPEPEPQVFFMEFGDSALNFEVRCWVPTPELRFRVKSELNYRIYEALNENDIEIPFPQQDLHLRSSEPLQIKDSTD
ncbi:MAG: mechanosensitive ion channel family protein [bacterium]